MRITKTPADCEPAREVISAPAKGGIHRGSAFARAADAVAAARGAQTALVDGPVSVRMGLHTVEPVVTDEGYVGIDVHRVARVMGAGTAARYSYPKRRRAFSTPA